MKKIINNVVFKIVILIVFVITIGGPLLYELISPKFGESYADTIFLKYILGYQILEICLVITFGFLILKRLKK